MFSKELNTHRMLHGNKIRGGCHLIFTLAAAALCNSWVVSVSAVYFLGVKLRLAPTQNKVTLLYTHALYALRGEKFNPKMRCTQCTLRESWHRDEPLVLFHMSLALWPGPLVSSVRHFYTLRRGGNNYAPCAGGSVNSHVSERACLANFYTFGDRKLEFLWCSRHFLHWGKNIRWLIFQTKPAGWICLAIHHLRFNKCAFFFGNGSELHLFCSIFCH